MWQRKWLLLSLLCVSVVMVAAALSLTNFGHANNAVQDKGKAEPILPIKQVVLFNSGVGYFQREGEVDGNTRVDLTFPISDINDLLKSLVLQDAQGRIGTVNYDSQDPIDKILHSFALDLNNNPTFGQILNQARGEKIEITRIEKKDAKATKITGTIVGMEVQKQTTEKDHVIDLELLNLLTTEGLQAIPMSQVVAVRFMNPILESEFQRALQVLAASHDTQKKTVSVGFTGEGKRPVRVGYVVERPIWKTSYRLRLEPNNRIFMQGWAIVENTSDDDWNNVRMVLVSGRPISFKMNLYEPLYIPRPTVEPELFASLRPPVYDSAMQFGGERKGEPAVGVVDNMSREKEALSATPLYRTPNINMPQGQVGGGAGLGGMGMAGGFGGGNANGVWGAQNNGLNFQNGANPNYYQNNDKQQLGLSNNRLSFEELQQRREQLRNNKDEAKKAGAAIAAGFNFKEGIASVASAEEIGDYYQYAIEQKISLARQKSAMLPIVDQTIDGSKVSIFNETIHTRYPLLGLRLKNTSGKPLTQGPISVYDGGTYAGDTRILDLQPGEERLLSYALDLGTEVKTTTKLTPSPSMTFKIGSDQLTARYHLRETKTYTIKNRSTHDRVVIVEHPIREGWKLVEPAKANEKSREVYRFEIAVAADKSVTYEVAEDQARVDTVALVASTPPLYPIMAGVTVKQLTQQSEEKLLSVKINKGLVFPTYLQRESRTYFVQNLSDQDREFTVDHVIRKEWVRLGEKDEKQVGPEVFRFKLKVEKGKTGQQEVVEERRHQHEGKAVKDVGDTKLREYLASQAISPEAREALSQILKHQARVTESRKEADDTQKQLTALTDDQARLRKNLEIIPQSAEPYKRFLDKFVTQETEIENLQRQLRQVTATLQSQQREYDTLLANLKVD